MAVTPVALAQRGQRQAGQRLGGESHAEAFGRAGMGFHRRGEAVQPADAVEGDLAVRASDKALVDDVAWPQPRIEGGELRLRLANDAAPAALVEPLRDVVGHRMAAADVDVEAGLLPGEGEREVVVLEVLGVGERLHPRKMGRARHKSRPSPERGPSDPLSIARAAMASAMATVRRAMSACRRSTMRPSSWMAPRPAFSGRAKAAMMARARFHLVVRGREDAVGGLDLVGVDQRLAVEAEVAALLAFGDEAVLVRRARCRRRR